MSYQQKIETFFNKLNLLCISDKFSLEKQLNYIAKNKLYNEESYTKISSLFQSAIERYNVRLATKPNKIEYPIELPVSDKKNEIYNLIKNSQVTIIAGETGSGKTTQIPKICLELGLGIKGYIGHTQPRRLAARSVANRIAQELNSEIGDIVGYKVRFSDHVQESTLIKLMTDGILLAEIQQDRLLTKYDTIIIDEAHERSLNIDFILGYLKQLLPKRPDLKVIITSATIDVDRFSQHFNNAPIIEVSGRTFPVEIRYRPNENTDNEDDQDFQGIINAIDELSHEKVGDILIFLTGEREIRDLAYTLQKLELKNTEIVPLYARLSASEQNRIFQSHIGRRIILSTNVAETSLTVPGIKYVIDTGLVRISRYSYRTKVQRLPIEPISQASANQRAGRCGRTSNGICIRLYDEQDFSSRPRFTDPEILRTNLASVILQMTALDLGNITAFPFVEAPEKKHISDGIRLLEELNAIYSKNGHYYLTDIGKMLAQLPIDPRLARMLVEAKKHGAVKELMVITAGLSIQDPRERPFDKQQASDEQHRRFADKQSDFIAFNNLWHYIQEKQKELSSKQFRQLCHKEFLNYLRIKEWQDIYTQIRQTIKQIGYSINSIEANYQAIHISILSGLLSHIGIKELEKHEYIGARNIKFAIFPGSGVFKSLPKWCIANELVETTRLWGRNVAKIEVEWIEPLAKHLCKSQYSEPRWSKKQGVAVANEKVTLFGLPIVTNRTINFSKIDPKLSRELFIRHALIYGEWNAQYSFYLHNKSLINEIEDLEHKYRRQDILVEEDTLFNFYDKKIPKTITSTKLFDSWWKKQSKTQPQSLIFNKNDLIQSKELLDQKYLYPDFWAYKNFKLPISYKFDIGSELDGATINIPIAILNQIDNEICFQWQVPGLREQLIIALIKSLPKNIRRNLVPAPNYAHAFLERVQPYKEDLLQSLEKEFRRMTGIVIKRDDWQLEQLPSYLTLSFSITNDKNEAIATGKDLTELRKKLNKSIQNELVKITQSTSNTIEKDNITNWDFGNLPQVYENKLDNLVVKAYPTLVDNKESVSIKLVNTEEQQKSLLKTGIRRLIYINIPSPIKYLHEKLPNKAKLGLYFNPFGSIKELIDDCIFCGIDLLIKQNNGLTFEESHFVHLLNKIKNDINPTIVTTAQHVEKILTLNYNISKKLKGRLDLRAALSLNDIKTQLSKLIYKGFVTKTGYERLNDLYRYLTAIEKRLDKLFIDPNKDRLQMLKVESVTSKYNELLNNIERYKDSLPQIEEIRWMIEELRVNLFAQQIGTPYPISEKRIFQAIEDLANRR
ncbi:ATP-dependent RNA helicase HrpA [Orbaceae bacterium ac157xtp]